MLFLHKAFVVICWIRIMLELEIISHEIFVVVGNPQKFHGIRYQCIVFPRVFQAYAF